MESSTKRIREPDRAFHIVRSREAFRVRSDFSFPDYVTECSQFLSRENTFGIIVGDLSLGGHILNASNLRCTLLESSHNIWFHFQGGQRYRSFSLAIK